MKSNLMSKINAAIIMDGNGRWAERRGLPRSAGHHAGVRALRRITAEARRLRLKSLTVYAFSADNWRRPNSEVAALMGLLRHYFGRELARFACEGIRLTVIGRRDRLPRDIVEAIVVCEQTTAANDALHLRIALDYSGREAIARAAQRSLDGLTPSSLSAAIADDGGPADIDLIIRTGGEIRLSDFLLWEAAYAELIFSERLWPDFDASDLAEAVRQYQQRERRFGGLGAGDVEAARLTT